MATRLRARPRLTAGAASSLVAAGCLAYPLADGSFPLAGSIVAVIALTALVGGILFRSHEAVTISISLVAAEYLLFLHHTGGHAALSTAPYAGGLVATAELAFWSLADGTIAAPTRSPARVITLIAATSAATAAGGALIILASRAASEPAAWLEPVGALSAAAVALVIAGRRARSGG